MSRVSAFAPFAEVAVTMVAAATLVKIPALDVADLSGNSPAPRQAARAGQTMKIDISGTVTGPVYYKFGDITVVATTSDFPIVQDPSGVFVDIPGNATHISLIPTGADVPVVRLTVGAGS